MLFSVQILTSGLFVIASICLKVIIVLSELAPCSKTSIVLMSWTRTKKNYLWLDIIFFSVMRDSRWKIVSKLSLSLSLGVEMVITMSNNLIMCWNKNMGQLKNLMTWSQVVGREKRTRELTVCDNSGEGRQELKRREGERERGRKRCSRSHTEIWDRSWAVDWRERER